MDPNRVLAELNALWASMEPGVVRACALTLVVLAEESDDAAVISGVVAEAMREHPCRAIVVRVRRDPSPLLEYRVTAQCWRHICCEQIEILTSEACFAGLAPLIVALRAPDLPLVVWYRSARLAEALPLVAEKVIVDGFPAAAPVLGDLAWTRITRWREIVARAFDNPAVRQLLPQINGVRVFYGGAQVPVEARYLAGWVRRALGRDLPARFETAPGEGVDGIEFTGAGISLRRAGRDAVLIRAGELLSCAGLPLRGEAALLGEELAILRRDPVYHESIAGM